MDDEEMGGQSAAPSSNCGKQFGQKSYFSLGLVLKLRLEVLLCIGLDCPDTGGEFEKYMECDPLFSEESDYGSALVRTIYDKPVLDARGTVLERRFERASIKNEVRRIELFWRSEFQKRVSDRLNFQYCHMAGLIVTQVPG